MISFLIQYSLDPIFPPIVNSSYNEIPNFVTFSWNSPIENCPELTYKIIVKHCGSCINGTDLVQTSVTCTKFLGECNFSLRSVICGDIVGDASIPVTINGKFANKLTSCSINSSY